MKKTLAVLVSALVLAGCGGTTSENNAVPDASGSSSSSQTTQSSASEPSESTQSSATATSDAGSSFVDGILTTPRMKIAITEHRVIAPGEPGNEYGEKPVVAFWYEITNLTDEEVSPMDWIFTVTAYQDNNPNALNEIEVAGLPDDRFLETQTEIIKNGGTVENAVAYELDDETTPVELVASDDLGMTEIGRVTFALTES